MKLLLFFPLAILAAVCINGCKSYESLFSQVDVNISDVNRAFSSLSTSGSCAISRCPADLPETLCDLIKKHADKNSDIVFLIDRTGSMSDDIKSVANSVNDILDCLPSKNVRIGCALYGDNNFDGSNWYTHMPFTTDFNIVKNYIDNIYLTGGGDAPESVYDALYQTLDVFEWSSDGGEKMLILLGDAPPQEPPLTNYTREDILEKANKLKIKINIYPVLISDEGC